MRKIIDGRTYNTETSKIVGSWSNGYSQSDFNYCAETLYRNTKKAYFLHGEGHGLSKYAGHHGNMRGWGEQIIPMTNAEAQFWAEKHLTVEEYEAEFGETEEAEGDLRTRERVNLTLDAEMMNNLRKLSVEIDIPMARMVDKAILAMYGDQFTKMTE